jgi:hypothetical protein
VLVAVASAVVVSILGGWLLLAQGRSPVPTLAVTPSSHRLSGTLTVFTSYTTFNDKTGKFQVGSAERQVGGLPYPDPQPPRFPDVTEGASITVKDADGRTVGATRLGAATLVEPYETTAPGYPGSTDPQISKAPEQVTHGFCAYQFSVVELPDSAFYRVQFGAQPETTLGRDELEQAGWTWKPSLGVAEDARQETITWYGNLCVRAAGFGGRC